MRSEVSVSEGLFTCQELDALVSCMRKATQLLCVHVFDQLNSTYLHPQTVYPHTDIRIYSKHLINKGTSHNLMFLTARSNADMYCTHSSLTTNLIPFEVGSSAGSETFLAAEALQL